MSEPNQQPDTGSGRRKGLPKSVKWLTFGLILPLLAPLLLAGFAANTVVGGLGAAGNLLTDTSDGGWFKGGSSSGSNCTYSTSTNPSDGGGTEMVGTMTIPSKAKPWVEKAHESSGGIPESYLAAIMSRESDFQPDVFSNDSNGGTWGLFQINREEWQTYYPGASGTPPTGITDPMTHADVGGRYLRARLEGVIKMQQNHPDAEYAKLTPLEALVIAHNAGEGNLKKYPNIPTITQSYLAEIRQNAGSDINWVPDGTTAPGSSTVPISSCTSGGGGAVTGTVEAGGAPTVNKSDFSWMCDTMKVCKAGDYGTFYPDAPAGYQCVWYAWTRLAMIHGSTGWTRVRGDGGEIWSHALDDSDWVVDTTPHPGDGISATAPQAPNFAGTTHVAVVEEVQDDPSGWKIRVSEGNMHQGSSAGPCYYKGTKGCWQSYRGDRWFTKADLFNGQMGPHFFRSKAWTQAA